MSIDRICTIGPASSKRETLMELIKHGMTIARLNFSHGTHESHKEVIKAIKSISSELGRSIKIFADLQGPKIRLGEVDGDKIVLHTGQTFTLHTGQVKGNENQASVDYQGIVKDVQPGNVVLINDGAVKLTVNQVEGSKVVCTVKGGGEIASHKGVNLPGVVTGLPALTEKDKEDIHFLMQEEIDYLACSFVRRASNLQEVRNLVGQAQGPVPLLVAKIETIEAVKHFREIVREADAIMIARGDLGVELPFQWIPLLQKAMISECRRTGTYCITATQMLQSMVDNFLPTRAEVTDVFQAVMDGTDAVMLSAESAAGHYPVESIETLRIVSQFAEKMKQDTPFDFANMIELVNKAGLER